MDVFWITVLIVWAVAVTCICHALRCCCFAVKRHKPVAPFPEASNVKDILRRGAKIRELPEEADAIVVGAGASGLAMGAFLTKRGYKTLVLEQHDRAGGGLHTFTEKGFEFDTGFHYCGELRKGEPLRAILDYLTGGRVEFTALDACPVDNGIYDEVRFLATQDNEEVRPFQVPAGKAEWVAALKREFPKEHAAIDAYVADMKSCVSQSLTYNIWRTFPKDSWFSKLTYPLLAARFVSFQDNAADRLDSLTDNQRLKGLLGYLSVGCCGVLPHQIQYSTVLSLHEHFSSGALYPVGGPSEIARCVCDTSTSVVQCSSSLSLKQLCGYGEQSSCPNHRRRRWKGSGSVSSGQNFGRETSHQATKTRRTWCSFGKKRH